MGLFYFPRKQIHSRDTKTPPPSFPQGSSAIYNGTSNVCCWVFMGMLTHITLIVDDLLTPIFRCLIPWTKVLVTWLRRSREFALEEASNLHLSPKILPHRWPQRSRYRRWIQDTITLDPPQPTPMIVDAIRSTILSSLLVQYVKSEIMYSEEQSQFIRCLDLTQT